MTRTLLRNPAIRSETTDRGDSEPVSTYGDAVRAALAFVFLIALILLAMNQIAPPGPVPATAPATEFSSGRAMQHLRAIAQKPHPIGSPAIEEVRSYLMGALSELGMKTEIQKTTVINPGGGFPVPAATVQNIIARLTGTDSSKALLLVAHYDSVPTGPGASDDGSSVAALLETVRAIEAGPPLTGDLIVLFTDGEEEGLLGAKAFIEEHPAARQVGLVLNFEARGNGGPSIMFETSEGNEWLIKEFAKAAPHPLANSLSQEVYKRLPNETDLTMFKAAGFAGLNFAFIKGLNHYHTALDNIAEIDEGSLQHQGSYALALARHFGNLNLEKKTGGNVVYFNAIGCGLIHYAEGWAGPLSIITLILLIAVIIFGIRKRYLTTIGISVGFSMLLFSLILSVLVTTGLWWGINMIHSGYGLILQGEPYNSGVYLVAFIALTLSITVSLIIVCRKKLSAQDIVVGCLLWEAILMLVTSFNMPGASYLFTWPLLFSLMPLFALFGSGSAISNKRVMLLVIGAIPSVMLLVPMIYLIYLAMTLRMVAALAGLVVLLIGLILPLIDLLMKPAKWMLPVAAALVGVVFILIGSFTSGFSKERPKPSSLFYAANADTGKAVYASFNQQADGWTTRYFAGREVAGGLADYIHSNNETFINSAAPQLVDGAPSLTLLDDKTSDGIRKLRIRLVSTRQAPVVSLYLESKAEVLSTTINGKRLTNESGDAWAVRYYALPQDGIELILEARAAEPLKIRAIDLSYGLPPTPGALNGTMPDNVIPSVYPYSNATLVSKTFAF